MEQLLLYILFMLTSSNAYCLVKNKVETKALNYSEYNAEVKKTITKNDSTTLCTGWYYILDSLHGFRRELYKSDKIYYLDPEPILTAKNIKSSEIYERFFYGRKYFGIAIQLDEDGTNSWSCATKNAGVKSVYIAFVLDNKLLLVLETNAHITNGRVDINRGDFSRQEVEDFKRIIETKHEQA